MGWEDLEEGTATTPVFLPGESPMDRGAWELQSMGVPESDTTEHSQLIYNVVTFKCIAK